MSSSTAWSFVDGSGATAHIQPNGAGTVTFSQVNSSGFVVVQGIHAGVARTKRVNFVLQRDPPPAQTSQTQSSSVAIPISSLAFGQFPAAIVTIASNGSGQITGQLGGSAYINNGQPDNTTRSWAGEFKFAYRPAGATTWTDFSGGAFQSTIARLRQDGEGAAVIDQPGAVSVTQVQSTGSASTAFDIGLFVREASSTNNADGLLIANFTGTRP